MAKPIALDVYKRQAAWQAAAMAIGQEVFLVSPVQALRTLVQLLPCLLYTSALGFLQLISKMGLKNSFIPLIVPSIAAPTVFFFMKQYLDCLLYTSRCV